MPIPLGQKDLSKHEAIGTVFDLVLAGVVVIVLGIGLVFASIVMSTKKEGGRAEGGGVVLIGPIPIVFGSDAKWATVAVVLAIVLMLISLIFYLG